MSRGLSHFFFFLSHCAAFLGKNPFWRRVSPHPHHRRRRRRRRHQTFRQILHNQLIHHRMWKIGNRRARITPSLSFPYPTYARISSDAINSKLDFVVILLWTRYIPDLNQPTSQLHPPRPLSDTKRPANSTKSPSRKENRATSDTHASILPQMACRRPD